MLESVFTNGTPTDYRMPNVLHKDSGFSDTVSLHIAQRAPVSTMSSLSRLSGADSAVTVTLQSHLADHDKTDIGVSAHRPDRTPPPSHPVSGRQFVHTVVSVVKICADKL